MNPIKFIKKVVLDCIEDIKFIFKLFKKEGDVIDPEKWQDYKKELKEMSIMEELGKSWYWIMAVVFALFIGILLSAKYYEMKCNNLIIEEYINPQLDSRPITPLIPVFIEEQSEEGGDSKYDSKDHPVDPIG